MWIMRVNPSGWPANTYLWTRNVGTYSWASGVNWTPSQVPNGTDVTVTFSDNFSTPSSFCDLGNSTYTIGRINITGVNSNSARLVLQSGVLNLSSSSSKPVINVVNTNASDTFLNVNLSGSNGYVKTGNGIVNTRFSSTALSGNIILADGGIRISANNNLGATSSIVQMSGGILYGLTNTNIDLSTRNIDTIFGTSSSPSQIQPETGATINMSGTLSSSGNAYFRVSNLGTLNLFGPVNLSGITETNQGTTNVFSQNYIAAGSHSMGRTAAGDIIMNWRGSGVIASGVGTNFILNDRGLGTTTTFNMNSGTCAVGLDNTSSTGRLVIGGKFHGEVNVNSGTMIVGRGKEVSVGSFFQYGGGTGSGVLNINGGRFSAPSDNGASLFIGYGQNSPTAGGTFGGSGVINLNGGIFSTGRKLSTGPNASGTINFNGGTYEFTSSVFNQSSIINVTTANILSGGAILLIQNNITTTPQIFRGSGSLIKNGPGQIQLLGNSTYTGGTIINSGILQAGNNNAFGTGTITVNAGGTLDRLGFAIPNVIINNGGTVIN